MANRYPLIANSSSNQIQELANADNLDLTGNNIVGVVSITASGNVTIGGTLTYEDVTNQDVIGLATYRSGVQFGAAGVGGTIRANGDTTLVGVVTAKGGFEIGAAGVGGTITSVGNAEFAGITTASKFSGPGNIPGNVTSGAYTIVASDAGKLVSATGTVTLPAATFEVGDAISVYNNTGSNMTLTCSAPTAVYLGTDGSTKTSLTLALRCICTFVCVDTGSNDTFVATGGGLS